MCKMNLRDFILERPLRIQKKDKHKILVKRGFIAAFVYSLFYGFYEYFIVYHYPRLLDVLGTSLNWSIMYLGLLLTVALATRFEGKFSIEQMLMGLLFMAMFEDVIYWMSQWIDTGIYPFPAGDWWDTMFASFRVLGGLGQPIPIWPYVPAYYLPGFGMAIGFYVCSYLGAKPSRIAFIIIAPLFTAVLLGTLHDEFFAIVVLIGVPLVCYLYVILLFYKNQWDFIQN